MNDKDQAAIDHVASVSKTPNARMILEWVMDGCVYDDYTDDDGNITAIRIEKRIEPKPAKPAYRVYKLTETTTTTIDRGSDTIPDDVEWLGDWIEYDPPKKWPTPLVERIAAIDLEAAQWIVDHWDDLLDIKYQLCVDFGRESKTLKTMFDWSETEQGSKYWESISKQLVE